MARNAIERPPGPSGLPLFGNTFAFVRDPLAALQRWANEYGDIAYLRFPGRSTYLLTDPEHIERVLVTESHTFTTGDLRRDAFSGIEDESLAVSEGQTWQRQRQQLQPGFYRKRITSNAETMVKHVEQTVDRWPIGTTIDVMREMDRLTLAILTTTLFDHEMHENQAVVRTAVDTLIQQTDYSEIGTIIPNWIPTPANRRFQQATNDLHSLIEDLIRERRHTDTDGDDLLSLLVGTDDTTDADGGLSGTELRDNIVGLLLAGHETSALALTYTWYLLSKNPAARRQLHTEIADVLDGTAPTADQLPELEYTEQVLLESMRLYPPIYGIAREPVTDVTIGGYTVPAGATITIPQWVVHHDGRFYDDPDAFRPARWSAERDSERPEFAYFPFGGGPRHCIGDQFALMEMKLVLATIAQRVSLELVSDAPLDFTASVTTRPTAPIEMVVRDDTV
ncbi:cytochrome P450 [Halocatena pleomorpha]|uniref:Cytochrome P450 n=1 Tax=Halocatena pleomorpha TaxID=1785090 RepID=A0A3P3RA09_9EURY|nr:cytochrome P450 [Halocatena pleomorpha]RRJ30332.1 cytochrome P450 [Halocatena pleomorpha]